MISEIPNDLLKWRHWLIHSLHGLLQMDFICNWALAGSYIIEIFS